MPLPSAISSLSNQEMANVFLKVNSLVGQLHSISSDHFLPLSKQIKSCEQVTHTASKSQLQYLGRIITTLQYHDIIRQRLEHIEEIHDRCIEELLNLCEPDRTLYVRLLPKIIELNTVQLKSIHEEFQKAAEDLESSLQEWNNCFGSTLHLFTHSSQSVTVFYSTSNLVLNKLNDINTTLTINYTTKELPSHLEKIYTMQSERDIFYQVFNPSKRKKAAQTTSDQSNIDFF